jgi:hypothetical protein
MELKIWCKTFLNVYRCLEKITQAIDKIVLTTGLNLSMEANVASNKILQLTERKITLINLKLFIEKLLNSLPEEHTKLIMLRYVDQAKSEDIAKQMGISSRTYFRKSIASIKSMELALKRTGKTHESLKKEYENETWILALFQKLMQQEVLSGSKTTPTKANKQELFQDARVIHFAYENYKKTNASNLATL